MKQFFHLYYNCIYVLSIFKEKIELNDNRDNSCREHAYCTVFDPLCCLPLTAYIMPTYVNTIMEVTENLHDRFYDDTTVEYTPVFQEEDRVWLHDPYDEYKVFATRLERYGFLPISTDESWKEREMHVEAEYIDKVIAPLTIFRIGEVSLWSQWSDYDDLFVECFLRKEFIGWSRHIVLRFEHEAHIMPHDVDISTADKEKPHSLIQRIHFKELPSSE